MKYNEQLVCEMEEALRNNEYGITGAKYELMNAMSDLGLDSESLTEEQADCLEVAIHTVLA